MKNNSVNPSQTPSVPTSEIVKTGTDVEAIRALAASNTGPKFGYTHQLCQGINYLLTLLDQKDAEIARLNTKLEHVIAAYEAGDHDALK